MTPFPGQSQETPAVVSPGFYYVSECGYCGGEDFASYGLRCRRMSPGQYKYLIDRGFRRSGCFLYKPDLFRSCCKLYVIRCEARRFHCDKEQRKCVNRLARELGAPEPPGPAKGRPFDLSERLLRHIVFAEDVEKYRDQEKIVVRYEESVFSEEKYRLYDKYQRSVHKEESTKPESFRRFLCDNPFPVNEDSSSGSARISVSADGTLQRPLYGAVHQCYYYKGQLICVGVLDYLPGAISSVYLMYDPDMGNRFSLGKLSALVELLSCLKNGVEFYYMGYYIHDCGKMRYKRGFKPCWLLNPLSLKFERFEDFLPHFGSETKQEDSEEDPTNNLVILKSNEETLEDLLFIKDEEIGQSVSRKPEEHLENIAEAYNYENMDLRLFEDNNFYSQVYKTHQGSDFYSHEELDGAAPSFIPGTMTGREILQLLASGDINIQKGLQFGIPNDDSQSLIILPWNVLQSPEVLHDIAVDCIRMIGKSFLRQFAIALR